MDNVVIENKLPLVEYMLFLIGNSILTISYLILGLFILYVIYRIIVVIVKTIKFYFETRKYKEVFSEEEYFIKKTTKSKINKFLVRTKTKINKHDVIELAIDYLYLNHSDGELSNLRKEINKAREEINKARDDAVNNMLDRIQTAAFK